MTEHELVWVDLAEENVLVGHLDPAQTSRLGMYKDEPGLLHADLNIEPDETGRIVIRVPNAISPDRLDDFEDISEIWEPRFDEQSNLVGARGVLHYQTRLMPDGELHLDIQTQENRWGTTRSENGG